MNTNPIYVAEDPVWTDRGAYVEVEERQQMIKARMDQLAALPPTTGVTTSAAPTVAATSDLNARVTKLERENQDLKAALQKVRDKLATFDDLQRTVKQLKTQIDSMGKKAQPETAPASGSADDDVDLFGSDSEDEEATKIRTQRLQAYHDKKSQKPVIIAKSSIIFDVKPWDDETDMAALEAAVRSIKRDGLLWGASKLVPLAYGIHKLQINSVIEDEKISVDELQESMESFEDYVQSVDIFAFNKI